MEHISTALRLARERADDPNRWPILTLAEQRLKRIKKEIDALKLAGDEAELKEVGQHLIETMEDCE